jgi:ABC-type multidrug transport system fused ATPase/permease subunit
VAEILSSDQMLPDTGTRVPPGRASLIELDRVTFGYTDKTTVLRRVSLQVAPGERVALVGTSGAGKSTIGALVARFYDPNDGRVLIDGHPAAEYPISWLRDQVGILLQDTLLFSGTVAENILYGARATPEQIVAAATAAGADRFIRELPGGYDSMLGDRGVGLSGGQRQRIGIARVLLRNPSILVLDEPTTGLDAQSEAEVMDALSILVDRRTTLIVTHSIALARSADRIVVIEDGRVVESGTPDELLSRTGRFAELAEHHEQWESRNRVRLLSGAPK